MIDVRCIYITCVIEYEKSWSNNILFVTLLLLKIHGARKRWVQIWLSRQLKRKGTYALCIYGRWHSLSLALYSCAHAISPITKFYQVCSEKKVSDIVSRSKQSMLRFDDKLLSCYSTIPSQYLVVSLNCDTVYGQWDSLTNYYTKSYN